MLISRIKGATRTIGLEQGYQGLPLRDELIDCPVNGPGMPVMTTAWIPTPAELEQLVAGGAIHVQILGRRHPPIMVEVGPAPELARTEG